MSKRSLALRRVFVLASYAAVLAVILIAAYVNGCGSRRGWVIPRVC
jgi:hypothetical protein